MAFGKGREGGSVPVQDGVQDAVAADEHDFSFGAVRTIEVEGEGRRLAQLRLVALRRNGHLLRHALSCVRPTGASSSCVPSTYIERSMSRQDETKRE
jgi:hypothetical protein